MLKKNYLLIVLIISFLCFYLPQIYGLEYLHIIFIPLFFFIHRYLCRNKYSNESIKIFKKYNILVGFLCIIIYLALSYFTEVEKIYYDIFISLALAIAVLTGSLQNE